MIARPKPGDSDEDILADQNVFEGEKRTNKHFRPAAKLVGTKKHEAEKEDSGPQTQKQPKLDIADKPTSTRMDPDKIHAPVPMAAIIGDIVEKNSTSPLSLPSTSNPICQIPKDTTNTNSTSIFAQRVKNKRSKNTTAGSSAVPKHVESPQTPQTSSTPDCSMILEGENAMEIHLQNKSLLDGMTEEEILTEKQNLLATVDPSSLKFIQSLNKKSLPNPRNVATVKREMTADVSRDVSDYEIISHPDIKNWVHFNTLERDKLEWIKYLKSAKVAAADKPYEARFDFKGYLLPYTIEYNEQTKTLFHHGDEPHRPGYTLNELFQLCRSTVTQQRALALNTLAGLLEYHSLNIYDEIIDVPITKIFFVLRFAIDENIRAVLEPALKGLRNMFYHRVDEACLDNFLGIENGLLQPRLIANKIESEESETDVTELKDFHLTDLDLISGALRTDILPRIRYILTTVKPGALCVEYCLQILIRIARDSTENAEKIIHTDGLFEHIFEKYIPKVVFNSSSLKENSEHHKITINALKLVRVLSCQSRKFVEFFQINHAIYDTLFKYLDMTVDSIYLTKMQTEVFYVLAIFSRYNIDLVKLRDITPLIQINLRECVNYIDMTSAYSGIFYDRAISLFTFLSSIILIQYRVKIPVIDNSAITHIDNLLTSYASKWCYQIGKMKTFSSLKLNLITSVFICLNSLSKVGYKRNKHSHLLDVSILNMINTPNYYNIATHLSKCSNILSPLRSTRNNKNSSNPGLCSILLASPHKLLPALENLASFSFMSILSKFLIINGHINLNTFFLRIYGITSYLSAIDSAKQLNFCDNWFSRVEIKTLFNLIEITTKSRCSEEQKTTIYDICFKLSYILSDVFKRKLEFLFRNIIFNKEWFSADRLLQNLSLDESTEVLNNLNPILECYIHTLNINTTERYMTFTISNWNEPILPRDWIYMPILGLYSRFQKMKSSTNIPKSQCRHERVTNLIVSSCLKWILISELYFPDITNEIHLTDRFCRLICIFLCDNSVFLDPNVKFFLKKCVRILFELEKTLPGLNKLDFNRPILGVTSFQDLYMQLVDHYQAVSYGDPVFAACVLVPLAQKHNIKWRKIVWSEYAGSLKSLDCPEDMLCYDFSEYLNPPETDLSLLKCYNYALNGYLLRRGTIAYKIAHHHVEAMKNRQRTKIVMSN